MNEQNYTSTPPISHEDNCTGRKILTDLARSVRIFSEVVHTGVSAFYRQNLTVYRRHGGTRWLLVFVNK